MDIAGTQEAALQVAEPIEAKERVVAGATKVPIVDRALLIAVGQ